MAVYAVSDLHGNYQLWNAIKAILKPDDRLFMLGDAADRGDRGYDIIRECFADARVTYLKGNHDDLFVATAQGRPSKALSQYSIEKIAESWRWTNGGEATYQAWADSGRDKSIIEWLDNAPLRLEYRNQNGQTVILTHAGYTPPSVPSEYDLLWDRYHFADTWGDNPANVIMVHGHTPTNYMKYAKGSPAGEACIYCGGHKINIDAGTYNSNRTIMLNLDDFTEIRLMLKSGRVYRSTVEHPELAPKPASAKAERCFVNYIFTNATGYDYVASRVPEESLTMRILIRQMAYDSICIFFPNPDTSYRLGEGLGMHIVGRVTDLDDRSGGYVTVSNYITDIGYDLEKKLYYATTRSGSKYYLNDPWLL